MTAGGFRTDSGPLVTFAQHLDKLEGDIKSTAEVMGSCVADVGIFGIVGQLFGAGASKWCAEARDQLNDYAGAIGGFADKVNTAANAYKTGEAGATEAIQGLHP